jgi:uncharacterized protein (DUF488 family)
MGSAVYTIGHSTQRLDRLIQLLHENEVELLVDVRSYPFSRYVPQFNQAPLSRALRVAGILYEFKGRELGGRPQRHDYYDDRGYVLYYRVAKDPLFQQAIEEIELRSTKITQTVMCSEENPLICHRHLLVGRVLAEHGMTIRHIRSNGRIDMFHAEGQPQPMFDLFGSREETTWKSLRSVLQRDPQKTFLDK